MWRFEDETIHIDNLQVRCIVGVRPFEREHEQPLLLSIAFPADFAAAADAEALERTVDYSQVAKAARAFVQEGRFQLLETLARRLGVHLCERFGLARVSLHIRKPQAIHDSDGPAVSLTVAREGA
ncbi:MAG TPA: dihydroneopterin aldolase [bacterium]|nr:dihydroneopterin aldolase [bacterium]